MRRHDDEAVQEFIDRYRREPIEAALDEIAPMPVLLALAALVPRPGESTELGGKAREDDRDRSEEAPPMGRRTACMHRPAFDTAPALHPDLLRETVEVAPDIAMPPELPAAAARTPRRSGPGEELPLAHDLGQTGRHG